MKRLLILVVVGFLGSLTTSAAFAGNNGKPSNKEHSLSSSVHFSSEHHEKEHFEKEHCFPCDKSYCEKNWCETSYCFHDCTCDSYYDCFYDSSFGCYCYFDCNHECRHCDKSYCCDKSFCHDSKTLFNNTIHPIINPKPTMPVNTIHPIVNPIVRDHRGPGEGGVTVTSGNPVVRDHRSK